MLKVRISLLIFLKNLMGIILARMISLRAVIASERMFADYWNVREHRGQLIIALGRYDRCEDMGIECRISRPGMS